MENADLGKKIASLRKQKGWSQEKLAQALGVSNQAVSKWESGICCPDVLLLPEIAEQFGISLDELFGREPRIAGMDMSSRSVRWQAGDLETMSNKREGSTDSSANEEKKLPMEKMTVNDLPWEDDGKLRAVLFVGRTYQGHQDVVSRGQTQKSSGTGFQVHLGNMHWDMKNGFNASAAGNSADLYYEEKTQIEFCYTGEALDILSDFSVTVCEGNVKGNVQAGDGVTCSEIGGSVQAGDGVNCGNVAGNVSAGDSVSCEIIEGSASAGDSVTCGDVGGNVSAGDNVNCGTVGGSVSAGNNVDCGDVGGNITTMGKVTCGSVRGKVFGGF